MTTRTRETHKTAAIRRPKRDVVSPTAATKRSGSATGAILRDMTSPIPVERRLLSGGGQRLLMILAGAAVLIALIAALFVLPVKAWMRQRDDISQRRTELAQMQSANADLEREVARLKTDEGIKQAARQELGLIQRGEQRLTMVASTTGSPTLPSGWPYATVTQILSLRTGTPAPPPDLTPAASTDVAVEPAAPATPAQPYSLP